MEPRSALGCTPPSCARQGQTTGCSIGRRTLANSAQRRDRRHTQRVRRLTGAQHHTESARNCMFERQRRSDPSARQEEGRGGARNTGRHRPTPDPEHAPKSLRRTSSSCLRLSIASAIFLARRCSDSLCFARLMTLEWAGNHGKGVTPPHGGRKEWGVLLPRRSSQLKPHNAPVATAAGRRHLDGVLATGVAHCCAAASKASADTNVTALQGVSRGVSRADPWRFRRTSS